MTTLCQSLYFPAESYTIATFITVHVVLYYLCRDLDETALEQLHLSAAEARDIIDTCNLNVETAARSLRILMDPTYDNIQALTMAVSLTTPLAMSLYINNNPSSRYKPPRFHDRPRPGVLYLQLVECVNQLGITGFVLTQSTQAAKPRANAPFSGICGRATVHCL